MIADVSGISGDEFAQISRQYARRWRGAAI